MIENIIVVRTTSEPEVWDRAEWQYIQRSPWRAVVYTTTYDLTILLRNIAVASALTRVFEFGLEIGSVR